MNRLRKYLKNLYMDDLIYGAIGGLVGALIGTFMGNGSFFQVGLFTLIGMIFSCYLTANRRMSRDSSES